MFFHIGEDKQQSHINIIGNFDMRTFIRKDNRNRDALIVKESSKNKCSDTKETGQDREEN
tara:strand:- start:1525 stop:1704 length:180 start_codon:yes stop_codon:yes gene_type:complete